MPRPGRQVIVDLLKPLFKKRGFRKTAQTWRKEIGDFIQVFNLQSGAYGDYYMFNAGIYMRTLGTNPLPKEHDCGVRYRLDSLLRNQPMPPTEIESSLFEQLGHRRDQPTYPDPLKMSKPMDETVRAGHIIRLAEEAIDWLESISSRQAISALVERRKKDKFSDPRVLVCRDAYAYLGIPLAPVGPPPTEVTFKIEGESHTIKIGDKAALKALTREIMARKPKA